jgi:hypothetical protein
VFELYLLRAGHKSTIKFVWIFMAGSVDVIIGNTLYDYQYEDLKFTIIAVIILVMTLLLKLIKI